jgi:hypothetical protein
LFHRWYQSGTGRYTRPDPIWWRASRATRYSYSENQPLLYVDPLGLSSFTNNSDQPIPYKPEHGESFQLCGAGQTCDVDGVYPPSCSEYPIKIVGGCTAEVNMNGRLLIWCPLLDLGAPELRGKFPAAGQARIGGQTSAGFHKDHPDWPIPNGKPYCGCPAPGFTPPPPVMRQPPPAPEPRVLCGFWGCVDRNGNPI